MIEIHYAIGARSDASSNNTPRITDGDTFTSPTESSEELASLGGGPTLECSVSSFELVQQSRGSTESLLSSFTLVEADSMALEPGPELELLPDATPVPTEEEEFLANMSGEADEFGVRLCCLYPGSHLVHVILVPQIPPVRRHRPQGKSQSRWLVCGNVGGPCWRSKNDHQEIRRHDRPCSEGLPARLSAFCMKAD